MVWGTLFDKYRKEIIQSRLLMVEGKLQIEGEVIHVIVNRCHNFSKLLQNLTTSYSEGRSLTTKSRADETTAPSPDTRGDKMQRQEMVQGKIFGEGRNFR